MRVNLDREKVTRGLQVRGMTLTELARRAGLSIPTASAAAAGHTINIRTALSVARVLDSRPVIPELEALVPMHAESQVNGGDR